MGWRAGGLCRLVRQFLHLQRQARHLSGGSVRPAGVARQRHRQGPPGASRQPVRGERLVALAMGGARLECAVDRILQIARRSDDGRVDDLPAQWRRAGAAGAGSAMMEVVFVVAVAENGVIGSNGAIPWRLKSDMKRFKALTLNKPVVM